LGFKSGKRNDSGAIKCLKQASSAAVLERNVSLIIQLMGSSQEKKKISFLPKSRTPQAQL
jgi:hypothetical protein